MTSPPRNSRADSGIPWVGRIPGNWKIAKLKRVASLRSGSGITSDQIRQDGDYPVYGGGGLRGYTSSFTHEGHFPLIGRQGALCGNINYARGKFWASEHAVVVKPLKDANPVWLGELLRAMKLGQYSVSAAQPGLAVETIRELFVPIPPTHTQRAIADFLDRKTLAIDDLIRKKERLIELLKEKRQALITQVVTKGLDTSVPMKDSGVPWLGKVPARWTLTKVKRVCLSVRDGTHDPPPRVDSEYRLLSARNIQDGAFILRDDDRTMSEAAFRELERSYTVRAGDVLIATVGATTGKSAVVGEVEKVSVQRSLGILRPGKRILSDYLNAWLTSSPVQLGIAEVASQYAAQGGIYLDDLANLPVALPDLCAQQEILTSTKAVCEPLERATQRLLDQVDRLREYRQALISAAVTGQIDISQALPAASAVGT